MVTQDVINILQHPQNITEEQTNQLLELVATYPYFQSGYALLLKGLKNSNSSHYNLALKKTAAYTTDRSILFDFITSDVFNQNNISEKIKQNEKLIKELEVNDFEDISVNKSVIIDNLLQQQIKDTEGVLDPKLFEAKNSQKETVKNIFTLDEAPEVSVTTPEETLEIGKPLEFSKNETHSFGEWLKLTSFKPIIREEAKEVSHTKPTIDTSKKEKKFEIIDKFIQNNPKIPPVKKTISKENLANSNMSQPESLMTETLARIYLEQKNYKKAIQAYKILSLKYPEKSSLFANQIKAVQKLQEQNKNL